MSAIAKGPKNGSRNPKVLVTIVSTSAALATPSSTIDMASFRSTYCRRLRRKPGTSATCALRRRARAGTRPRAGPGAPEHPLHHRDHGGVGLFSRHEFDARDERGRIAPVHRQE